MQIQQSAFNYLLLDQNYKTFSNVIYNFCKKLVFVTTIVKRVSWFKSSLLLRIQIKYTHKLQFLIKTTDSIFNRKIYTTDERRKPSVAWLGFLRQTLS
jgi:hypothetical protein